MRAEHVQNLRYKLQKRFRRLNSAGFQVFHYSLKQFWGFLTSTPVFAGIIQELAVWRPEAEADARRVFEHREALAFDSELEEATVAYWVVRLCAEEGEDGSETQIGQEYSSGTRYDEAVEAFLNRFVEPLYEYLDEHLDDQRAILAVLRRYKHTCEWFQREQLDACWRGDSRRGEKRLALHLYEYLHNHGIDFSIEPSSASGEADLVAAQDTNDPLIADAKIFDPEHDKGKPYVINGFHQVYQYTLDFNQSFGYLIVYRTCPCHIRYALKHEEQGTPFVVLNNKTIFLLTIDICVGQPSASKRGRLDVVTIIEEDLVRSITGEVTE
jgi:hypothetical protein